MSIPIPPTDSLYKFTAITGIFITCFCFGVTNLSLNKVNSEAAILDEEIDLLTYRREVLDHDMSRLSEDISELEKTLNIDDSEKTDKLKDHQDLTNQLINDVNIREYYKFLIEYGEHILPIYAEGIRHETLLSKLKEQNKELGFLENKIRIKKEILVKKMKVVLRQEIILAVGMIIGIIISYKGFQLWYTRVQKYIDIEIKNKSI